jgi:hypothetical protein
MASEQEKIIGPTPDEIRRANQGILPGKTERFLNGLANRVGLRALFAVDAVVAGYVAYQNVPVIHESINSFPNSFNPADGPRPAETKKVDPEEVFDNSAEKGVIGPKNILYVPPEVYNQTPLVDKDGNPILDFPWDPKHPVEMRYEKILSSGSDKWKSGPPNPGTANSFKGKDPLPAGFEFPTLYSNSRVFFMGNDGSITTAKIEFIANGTLYSIVINLIKEPGLVTLYPLIDVVYLGPKNRSGKDWEKGTLVEGEGGQKIFRTTEAGKLIMSIDAIKGDENGSFGVEQKNYKHGNFVFKTGEDDGGVEKLLARETLNKP